MKSSLLARQSKQHFLIFPLCIYRNTNKSQLCGNGKYEIAFASDYLCWQHFFPQSLLTEYLVDMLMGIIGILV